MDQRPATFGEQLRRFRIRAGLSQVALAELANLAPAAVGALERERRRAPYPQTLNALAEALRLSLQERAQLASAIETDRRRPPAPAAASSPPLADRELPPSNLPRPRTALIGRDSDLTRVAAAVTGGAGRLVSVTGAAGVGKTSLALHVADRVRGTFRDGAWLIELASLTDQALLSQLVAEVLGLPETAGQPPDASVRAFLATRSALLLLDNCEHVLEECAYLVESLLASCPGVRVLATSREPLLVPGELQVRLSPLAVVESQAGEAPLSRATLSPSPAAQLFLARAQTDGTRLAITADDLPVLESVCARLDGLPLAIELAAARARMLTPRQILARLDDLFNLLVGANRFVPTRHQTLRAALDWSYALLAPDEQAAFRRLALFVGGFDLDLAEAVTATSGVEPGAILDLLARLVDKSLVVASSLTETTARYRLLEPVREYARRQLTASGELAATGRRHAFASLALAEDASRQVRGSAQLAGLARLERELPNLRVAARWAQAQADTETLLRLSLAVLPYWEIRGPLVEGRAWLTTVLEQRDMPPAVRAQALLAIGRLAFWQADLERATDALDEALQLAAEVGDAVLRARVQCWLGAVARRRYRPVEARAHLRASLAEDTAGVDPADAAWARGNDGLILIASDSLPDRQAGAVALDDCLRRYRAIGNVRMVAMTATILSYGLTDLGQLERVPELLDEALDGFQATGDRVSLGAAMLTCARIAARLERPIHAVHLLGAAETMIDAAGASLAPGNRVDHDIVMQSVTAHLNPAAVKRAMDEGRSMTFDAAAAEVRALVRAERVVDGSVARAAPVSQPGEQLTPREQEVVQLLARRYSDGQIAAALGIAVGTARVHVHKVLAKQGLHSRWQVHDRVM